MAPPRPSCKPPQKTSAPWGSFDAYLDANSHTTYSAAYQNTTGHRPCEKIVPKSQHDWSGIEQFMGQSTAAAAYTYVPGRYTRDPIRRENNLKKDDQWNQPYTTSSQSQFLHPNNPARARPFPPARPPRDDTPMNLETTSGNAYKEFNLAFAMREPFVPKEQDRVDEPFHHTSTSRSSYPPHFGVRYVPAKKPQNAMGSDGALA